MSRPRPLTVVIPGVETRRRVGARVDSQPSLVAVDATGRARYFGRDAILAHARRHSNLSLRRPFIAYDVADHYLAVAYMTWQVETATDHANGIVLVVPHAPAGIRQAWRAIAGWLPGRVAIVPRPIALASGLGLDIDTSTAHMVVDLRSDDAEISILAEGGIVASAASRDVTPESLARVARALLEEVDPDVEDDINQRGLHLVGNDRVGLAPRLGAMLSLPMMVDTDQDAVLMKGIDVDHALIESYLDAVRPPSPIARVMSRLRLSPSA